MVDWTASMQQTFEYYIVDPGTWRDMKLLDMVTSATIEKDLDAETLGSASIDLNNDIDECYVRTYLITIQNEIREKHPLGTHLIQTPSSKFNGRINSMSVDAYTPLIELKEKPMPLGYSIPKNQNVMTIGYQLTRENVRAPVVKAESDINLYNDFVADINETMLSFLSDLIANAKYEYALDDLGRILFAPKQDLASLQPVWTFNDDNSSILYPELTMTRDIYGIPNVVEVVYSTGSGYYYARAVNDDENNPLSTVNRGREIVYRDSNPDIAGNPTNNQIDEYAEQLLRDLSTVEYSITYTHGYCPVRPGDCVRLNYERANLKDIKAKVIKQSIKCVPGCPVTETAVFTTKLWR